MSVRVYSRINSYGHFTKRTRLGTCSVFDYQIYEVISEKPAIEITTLLFSKGGKGSFMCNVPQTGHHTPWPLITQ